MLSQKSGENDSSQAAINFNIYPLGWGLLVSHGLLITNDDQSIISSFASKNNLRSKK